MSEPLLVNLMAKVAEWFPELGGRSIAASEMYPDRQNLPTLPLAVAALVRIDGTGFNWKAANARHNLFDEFIVDFWLEPVKIKRADGTETPFWAFYDYEAFRDTLLSQVVGYFGPRGQRLDFRGMNVESDEYAVILSFTFRAHYAWCRDDEPEEPCAPGGRKDGDPITPATIRANLFQPRSFDCGPITEPKDCDPCTSE